MSQQPKDDFVRAASASNKGGLLSELWYLVNSNKKWWLVPFLIPLLLMGAIMILGGTGAAPFIYTLF